tara:strand:- start:29 stop:601 length:573 start_codon:yes stop_codon:yes gene_type:complete
MIYCIHRSRDEKRLKELNIELKKVDLKPVFIEPEEVKKTLKETNIFNKEMDSLRRTTIKIIEKAKKEKLPYVTIMEDDCKFNVDLYKNFESKKLPDFDFIHLNVIGKEKYGLSLIDGVFRKFYGTCCQYYIVNNKVYDEYLQLLKDNLLPIDEITRYIQKKRRNSFAVEPFPIYHKRNKYSTLKGKIVKY